MVSYETFVSHFSTQTTKNDYSSERSVEKDTLVVASKEKCNVEKMKSKTFKSFLKNANVLSSNQTLIPLTQYIKNKKVTLDDIKYIYFHICEREQYLERFYKKSLEIPENIHITIPPMPAGKLDNNQKINYKNVIRNMFWLEILKKTKSGFPNILSFFDVLENLYKEEIIDYKLLTPSAISYIRDGRIGSVFSSFYFRASIMNPYLVYSLAKSVLYKYLFSNFASTSFPQNSFSSTLRSEKSLKFAKVFTPTLGWGSYLYGFAETECLYSYTGIDVIPSVCKKTFQFAKKIYPSVFTQIICCPSEDLLKNSAFIKKHKEQYNIVFFSPPYFKLELYEGKLQSTNRYSNYQDWLLNYWEKTVQLSFLVLEKGGVMCYILSGYGSEDVRKEENFGGGVNKNSPNFSTLHSVNGSSSVNLIKDMNNITKKYFTFVKMYNMYNKNVHSTKHANTNEKIIVFYK